MATAERLIEDIEELGMPVILVNHHGFMAKVIPTWHTIEQGAVVLWGEDLISRISLLGEVDLQAKTRPDNYIVDCKRCYNIRQIRDDAVLAEIFWVK